MTAAYLGLSFDYHDAAAALVIDGEPVAAAAEERFSRRKHDPELPRGAVRWALDAAELTPDDLTAVAFYSKPLATYERVLAMNALAGPAGVRSLGRAVSIWSRSKLWVGYRIECLLQELGATRRPRVVHCEHHLSHAWSAFVGSPFDEAAVLTFDGVGEWTTTSIGHGRGGEVRLLAEQRFPDSLGLLYSTVTAQCGFDVNDGEYKLMGLAPYGRPTFVDAIRSVARPAQDGSLRLDMRCFGFPAGRRMGSRRLDELLDGPPREPGAPIGRREADLAASMQVVLEDVVLSVARRAHELTGARSACLAGGVALNCVANARLAAEGPFEQIWVQPAAGDDGGALGAAWWACHQLDGVPRTASSRTMRGAALGPRFSGDEIARWLASRGVVHERAGARSELWARVARELADGATVGWFQGAMEFGPRALGHRSILADPRRVDMAQVLNTRVKGREGFRPFAPAVMAEHAADWFELEHPAPFMTLTAKVRDASPRVLDEDEWPQLGEVLAERRSQLPACTHLDGSARVQTVAAGDHPELHALLGAFDELTGCPVLLNTSFNAAGEPIVCTPADALDCFERTGVDLLVLEDCLVRRADAARSADAVVAGGELM